MEPKFGIWEGHVGGGHVSGGHVGGGHVGGEWEWIQIGDENTLVVGTCRPTDIQKPSVCAVPRVVGLLDISLLQWGVPIVLVNKVRQLVCQSTLKGFKSIPLVEGRWVSESARFMLFFYHVMIGQLMFSGQGEWIGKNVRIRIWPKSKISIDRLIWPCGLDNRYLIQKSLGLLTRNYGTVSKIGITCMHVHLTLYLKRLYMQSFEAAPFFPDTLPWW